MFAKTCVGITLLAVSCTTVSAPPAHASPDWDAIAACESGGNWNISTGNGYSGGLQWAPGTWAKYRSPDDPLYAADASREAQIAAADRLYAVSGLGSWPVCGRRG